MEISKSGCIQRQSTPRIIQSVIDFLNTLMKTEDLHKKDCAQVLYVSPKVKVVEINARVVLCQSGGIDSYNMQDDDTSYWN